MSLHFFLHVYPSMFIDRHLIDLVWPTSTRLSGYVMRAHTHLIPEMNTLPTMHTVPPVTAQLKPDEPEVDPNPTPRYTNLDTVLTLTYICSHPIQTGLTLEDDELFIGPNAVPMSEDELMSLPDSMLDLTDLPMSEDDLYL